MFLYPIEDLKFIESELGLSVAKFKNKTIYLTGSTGFIGKCLVESLVWLNRSQKLNLTIHSLSRSPENFFKKYPHFVNYFEFHLLPGDIRNQDLPFSEVQADFVIHAAADVVGKINPSELYSACIDGTSNVLNFSKKFNCKKFLLLSSGAIYGEQPQHLDRLSESYLGDICLSSPNSTYALGKRGAEWLVRQAKNEMNVQTARCFAFIGPYLPLDEHYAIGNFLRDSLLGRDIEIRGNGSALRTYLYTSDLIVWLLKMIALDTQSGGAWNVGGDQVISIGALAKIIVQEINPDLKINIQQPIFGNPHRYVPDVKKAAIELALTPKIQLMQAIHKTAQWNRKHGKY